MLTKSTQQRSKTHKPDTSKPANITHHQESTTMEQQQQNERVNNNGQQHVVSDEGTTSLSEPSSWTPPPRQEGSKRAGEGESDDSHSLYNSSEQGTESTTKEPGPSTSEEDGVSSLDSGSEADDEEGGSSSTEESITSMIGFLREKQRLLKRASDHFAREEAYNAFNAANDSKLPASLASVETGIWNDAKKFLMEESGSPPSSSTASDCSGGDSDDAANKKKRSCVAVTATLAPSILKCNPCLRAKGIDISQVNLMSSKAFEREYRPMTHSLQQYSKVDMAIGQQNWMAHALTVSTTTPTSSSVTNSSDSSSSSSNAKTKNDWQLVSDPQTCSAGLLPPRHMSLRHSVTLQEAIAITDDAQLVTQSMPPFTVVSANKAFLQLAGLKSTKKIVGEPIESILQLSQQQHSKMSSPGDSHNNNHRLALTEASMASVLFWIKGGGDSTQGEQRTSNKIKACNLQVKPVVHEAPSKRRRLNDNEPMPTSSSSSSSYLSHLLVVLQETRQQAPVVMGTVG